MRFVAYGAGAVGGVIGAHLHLSGRDVTLVARGAHLDAVHAEGLRLDAGAGVTHVPVPAVRTASDVEWVPDTVVVLAVKSQQVSAALADLRAHAPSDTVIVCATNGVATEASALRLFERVYSLCVMLPSTHLEPGLVVAKCHPVPGILDIGRVPAGTDQVSADVSGHLRAAGFASEERADIMSWKRRKLLLNVGNGVDASFRQDDAADALTERAVAEGERVLAAAGLTVVSAEEDRRRRGDLLRRRPDLPAHGGSTWQSVQRGTGETEIDYLAGEIVLQGRLHGVATPACDAIVAATRHLAATRTPARSLDAATALVELDARERRTGRPSPWG